MHFSKKIQIIPPKPQERASLSVTIPKNSLYKIDKKFFKENAEAPYITFKSDESPNNKYDEHIVIIPSDRSFITYYGKIYDPMTKAHNKLEI